MSKFSYEEQKALPPASVGAESVDFSTVLPPRTLSDIWQYFSMKQRQPDAEAFADFHDPVFRRLQKGLDDAFSANNNRQAEPVTTKLRLRPPAFYHQPDQAFSQEEKKMVSDVNSGEKIHLHNGVPEATQALMELTYSFTGAEEVGTDSDLKSGSSRALLKGNYKDLPVFFVETKGQDWYGEYLTWEVTDSPPEELYPREAPSYEHRPFFVHSERVSAMEEHIADVESWPTVQIDEDAVVQSWVSRQTKHRKAA